MRFPTSMASCKSSSDPRRGRQPRHVKGRGRACALRDPEVLESRALLATSPFLVTTTADSGPGSLRQAIIDSNNAPLAPDESHHLITFQIPWADPGQRHFYYRDDGQPGVSIDHVAPVPTVAIDGTTPITSDADLLDPSKVGASNTIDPNWSHSWWTIRPQVTGPDPSIGMLPPITTPVVIDGYSQGYGAQQYDPQTGEEVLNVVLDGSAALNNPYFPIAYDHVQSGFSRGVPPSGLLLETNDSTVQGLVVQGWAGIGIGVFDPLTATNSFQNDRVRGNFIGTDPSGTISQGNQFGVAMIKGARNNRVGADGPGDFAGRNLISGQFQAAVLVGFDGGTSGNVIAGNLIGTDATGSQPLQNGYGVVVVPGAQNSTVGGAGALANTIANGLGPGVWLVASSPFATSGAPVGITITGNSIHDNGSAFAPLRRLGIDLGGSYDQTQPIRLFSNHAPDGVTPNGSHADSLGPNHWQAFPTLFTAAQYSGTTAVSGRIDSAAAAQLRVEFFASPVANPAGYGEGQVFLGSLTVSSGVDFVFRSGTNVPAGWVITATATAIDGTTGQLGDTSEFSHAEVIAAPNDPIFARDDRFDMMSTSQSLSLPLGANDINITANSGSGFTINVVTQPQHGTLTRGSDGSYAYTPSAGFSGADGFTYEDVDGASASNVATVRINVVSNSYLVTTADDFGPGSLRQAIIDANQDTQAATFVIDFGIPGAGPFTISPQTALPAITHPVVIDGYSQGLQTPDDSSDDATPNNLSDGDNAVIKVVLDGQNISDPTNSPFPAVWTSEGLTITASAGGSTIRGLRIGNFGSAIVLRGGGSNTVAGNFIGSGMTPAFFQYGLLRAPQTLSHSYVNTTGILVTGGSTQNLIGTDGTTTRSPADRNVISQSINGDIVITGTGTNGNVVAGNYVGTDSAGTSVGGSRNPVFNAFSPSFGSSFETASEIIISDGAQRNRIGSAGLDNASDKAERNIVLAHGTWVHGDVYGVEVSGTGTDYNVIAGNYIGTDVTGTRPLLTSDYVGSFPPPLPAIFRAAGGVAVRNGARHNRIGTDGLAPDNAGEGNLISGNREGIVLNSSDYNTIAGNLIGTDVSGTTSLLGEAVGIHLVSANFNTIGTNDDGIGDLAERNVVCGRTDSETTFSVYLLQSSNNVIAGNNIAVDASGTAALNVGGAIELDASDGNRIGVLFRTDASGQPRIDPIERNILRGGIGVGGNGNTVAGNFIGVDVTQTKQTGTGYVSVGGTNNTIGGSVDGLGNLVVGPIFAGGSGDLVRRNSTFYFGNFEVEPLGISGSGKSPVLFSVLPSGGQTIVTGILIADPNEAYHLDFYADNSANRGGLGLGQHYVATRDVMTGADGIVNFSVSLDTVLGPGQVLSVAAIDGSTNSTSSLSRTFSPGSNAYILDVDPTFGGNHFPFSMQDLIIAFQAADPSMALPGIVLEHALPSVFDIAGGTNSPADTLFFYLGKVAVDPNKARIHATVDFQHGTYSDFLFDPNQAMNVTQPVVVTVPNGMDLTLTCSEQGAL